MNFNFQGLGGRRFLLTLGTGISTTILQWFGKLDPAGSTYALTIAATVAAYITGNVAESRNNSQAETTKAILDK
jgi:threonine/homoserine efflux transporter RhtA